MKFRWLLSAVLCTVLLSACGAAKPQETAAQPTDENNTKTIKIENVALKKNPYFGSTDIQIDFSELEKNGFEFGDSLKLTFSNGTVLDDLPFHNGYYVKPNSPVAVYYPGLYGLNLAYNLGEGSWDKLGFSESDTVTIELKNKGQFLNEQQTFAQTHSNDLKDFDSPETFANFRSLSGGKILPDLIYRSASMTNNTMNRATVTDDLAEQYGVRTVLDFSDNEEELQKMRNQETWGSDYFDKLYENGSVKVIGLGVNPASDEFHKDLSQSLYWMLQQESPCLFFCTEGKDRTGYAASLLEALCGASYDEMLADYMKTYECYYGMTKETTPDQCKAAIDTSFDPIVKIMFEVQDSEDFKTIDYAERARLFLKKGGLSDAEIDEMVLKCTGTAAQ